ncbi:MAG TPA: hypothetical protein VN841_02370 [Bryobacteraceae bacterium]|nr:hypothetical protein [Bryobacteraceae bacterium]
MREKFWVEIAVCVMACMIAIGVMTTKTPGWGPRSIQAITIALGIPAIVILGLEQVLNSQAIAAILGAMVGFGVGKAATKE